MPYDAYGVESQSTSSKHNQSDGKEQIDHFDYHPIKYNTRLIGGFLLSKKRDIRSNSWILRKVIRQSISLPNFTVEGRNAVFAKKIVDGLIPQLQKNLGRRPTIGIRIGAAHASIVEHLLNQKTREAAIRKYSQRLREIDQTNPGALDLLTPTSATFQAITVNIFERKT